jgi:hypothetical protein
MDFHAERFLTMLAHGVKFAVAAAGRYIANNGRTILGLFAILLAAWGIDLQSVPEWAFAGKMMASTGVALKAWLSDSTSKSTTTEGNSIVVKQQVEVANASA